MMAFPPAYDRIILLLLLGTSCGNSLAEIISPIEAKMSSTWDFPASNCIDGNPYTMCHTRGLPLEIYPWVTLVIPRSIVRGIRITNRATICCWDRMKNMKVWVGNDYPNTAIKEYTGGTLLGTFIGPGTQGQVLPINTHEEVVGTHVVVQMKTDYINLMEIEVFGEPAPDTGCLTGWVHFDKKLYCFAQNTKVATWKDAVDNCYRMFMGSYPPSITSQEEQDFLIQRLEDDGNENVFIGAYYNRDRWTWWDGSPWDFSNWSESEPSGQNKRCSTMVRSGSGHLEWKWKDVSCEDNSKLAPLVCSYGGQNSCSDDPRCKIGQSRMKRETNDNVLRMTNSIARPGRIRRSVAHSMTWNEYHSIEDMYSYRDYLENEYDFVSTESIGKSYEGEDMRILKVCRGGCGNKLAIWIDGGIHAREWISPATATYIAKELIEMDGNHPELTRSIDWYIIPIMNPDGYLYSRTQNRNWRKSRSCQCNASSVTHGVDLNRNWGYKWMKNPTEKAGSNNTSHDNYIGNAPFSEVENRNARDFILAHKDTIKLYVSLHNYGEKILLPSIFKSSSLPDNTEELRRVGKIGSDAIKELEPALTPDDKFYNVTPTKDWLNFTPSGPSMDWAHFEAKIPYSYTLELTPDRQTAIENHENGINAFHVNESEITDTGKKAWAFFEAVATHLLENE